MVGQNHVLEQLESLLDLEVWGKPRLNCFLKICVQIKMQTKRYARSSVAAIGVLHPPHCEKTSGKEACPSKGTLYFVYFKCMSVR